MKNKVAFVTGGAKGMGEATVRRFAESGVWVAIADTDIAGANVLADELNEKGFTTIALPCDVSSSDQVQAAIDKTVETFGRLDYAFNNAGVQARNADLADISEDDYDRIMDINLKGIWLCMKYELLQMQKQGSGFIVNNSSIGGHTAGPTRSAYHASKHGVIGLSRSAAVEYAPKGVRINTICPGTIDTPMVRDMIDLGDLSEKDASEAVPLKRLGKAEEVADVVFWLCSDESSYVVGQSITVDGGYSHKL